MAKKWRACLFLGIRFLAVTQLYFGQLDTINYLLVVRNPSYDGYFSLLIFWATFGGKIGEATTCVLKGLGLPNPTKKVTHWVDLLSQPLSGNHVLEIFGGRRTPSPLMH